MKLIVAVDEQWGIGKNNNLLFSIPEDMKFFREATMGKAIIMGRRTLQSLPNSAPLKNRTNIVLTKDESFNVDGAIVCNTIEQVMDTVSEHSGDDVFVIGGHSVYEQLLDYCDEAYVTKVYKNGNADRFFPNLDTNKDWVLTTVSEKKTYDDIDYCFCKYANIAKQKF